MKGESKQVEMLEQVIAALRELNEDASVPKNIKIRIERTIQILSEPSDISIRVDKAQQELDDLSDDSNLQSYTRTQLWNVVSLLEKI